MGTPRRMVGRPRRAVLFTMNKYKKKPIILQAVYNKDMFCPKGYVVKWGKYRDVKTALEAKANLAATDVNGDTPLHVAASHGNAIIFQVLYCYKHLY